jgi:imidazolonepropionase-like amidohydrolase/Tol biopolymer transport system component
MRSLNLIGSLALSLLAATGPAWAAGKDKPEADKWDVQSLRGPTQKVKFETSEGTWMSVDVSPDGRQLVFDLLGDLYLLPIEGGSARRLTSGPAFDVQPRFSPDGREIAFTSDRGGGNNIWRIAVSGGEPSQVSKEDFRLTNSAVWTPDGDYLIARKHFTGQRSLGAGELWMWHKSGGAGLQLTKQKNDQQDQGEPAVSPDGRFVYFSEDMTAGPTFQYNKNPHAGIYAIRRLDRETGEISNLIQGSGGAVRPQPAPDGRGLAYVRRVRDKTVLQVFDTLTGETRPIWDGLSHDQQEAWAIFGPYPGFAWTPDGSAIVIWAQGGLWKVGVAGGEPQRIPFTAQVEQTVIEALDAQISLPESSFAPQMIRDVATRPDRGEMIFHAVGKLYRKALPGGTTQRLSREDEGYEYDPSYSADGRQLLYTTWSDIHLGEILKLDLASGERRSLSLRPGFYYDPRFSPDASKVVYARTAGSGLTGSLWAQERGIYWVPAEGGEPMRVAREGYSPQFNADGSRILYMTGNGISKKLMSVGLNGEEPREVFNLKYVTDISLSPDGRFVAFTELFNAYVAPMPQTGGSIELNKDSKAIPVSRISQDVGSYLHWSGHGDQQALHWMVGKRYFTRELKDAFAFLPGAPKSLPKPEDARGIDVGLSLPVFVPKQTVAFTGARIITMRDAQNREEVIEDGTLVVEGDRILAVGPRGEVQVPAGARVVDAQGKTLIPGIVDAHAHAAHFGRGVVPQQNWAYYANLAFGVTTLHDPSATTEFVFSQAELVQAGAMVGPRVFSTGTILYGADGDFKAVIDSLEDARSHLRRMQAHGAFSVKSYNQPRRDQRQQINQAARELGMRVVEEGGSTFFHNLTMILDGASTIEHNLPVAPLYRDVVQLWAATKVRNTPTLVVSYGGLSGEYWWYARDNVWEEPRLNRFFPRETLDARALRRETAPDWDYWHIEVAKSLKTLRDAGVRIQTSSHGQLQGLANHWEIWMLSQGGFSNFEALRAATIDGAESIGLGRYFGSLEAGKKADLVVLNSNPLEDIRSSVDTAMVMVGGRLFDLGADMAEVGGAQAPAPQFYWQRHGEGRSFGLQYGPTVPCHCPKSGPGHNH